MSLKQFLDLHDVRTAFQPMRPASPPRQLPPARVPPRAARPNRNSLLGTAFDYLVRFELRRLAPHARAAAWAAEKAPRVFFSETVGPFRSQGSGLSDQQLRLLDPDAEFNPLGVARQLRERALAVLAAARVAEEAHARSVSPSDGCIADLARHALRLAMLEPITRVSSLTLSRDYAPFAEPVDDDVRELADLLAVVPFDQFVSPDLVVLNPTFGEAGRLVGGADADLITGDLLVDFKLTAGDRVEPKHLDQVAGYLLLARHQRSLDPTAPEIRRVGIYYARPAHLWLAAATEWTARQNFGAFEEWFLGRAGGLRDETAARREEAMARLRVAERPEPAPVTSPTAGAASRTIARVKTAAKGDSGSKTPKTAVKPKGKPAAKGAKKPSGKAAAKVPAPRKRKTGRDSGVEPTTTKGGRG
jgi:hypothetical protein